jgi:signal transduction histidine kinase
MLNRLRITERLGLVLLLPFVAIILTGLPYTVDRVNEARAASMTNHGADNARLVGLLIQGLQQERLLLLAYGSSDRVDRTTVIRTVADVRELDMQTRQHLGGSRSLAETVAGLASLDKIRAAALNRAAAPTEVIRSYDDAVTALIDGLRLTDAASLDANQLRELVSLDSLLRANAESDRVAAAMVLAASDPVAAGQLAGSADIRSQSYIEQFRRQADAAQAAVVDIGVNGSSARLVRQLAGTLTGPNPSPIPVDVGLSAGNAATAVRSAIQNDVASGIAARARDQAKAAGLTAVSVAGFSTLVLTVVIWLGTAVSRSISRPLRRVTLAATTVAEIASRELTRVTDIESDDSRPPRLAAVAIRSDDEIGELASAFNRVQATAALMMEQQAATRRNVSVMFANIAHRTGGLVARQLVQIDELERGEEDEDRLTKLYRLDHVTTRLRRSSDSLLVIAGSRRESLNDRPISLADVIRSAMAQIEGFRSVALRRVTDVSVTAWAVPDLTLLLAELIENATAFSPPGQTVEVSATVSGEGVIHIVDRGIGMTDDRLAQENGQFVARERLDIAPTTTLGLLVVGRIARRHGITVRLRHTFGSGVTAEVVLPRQLFLASPDRQKPAVGPPTAINGAAATQQLPSAYSVTASPIPGSPGPGRGPSTPPDQSGLRRRQPGVALDEAMALDARMAAASPRHAASVRDPESERTQLSALEHGLSRAATSHPAGGQPPLGQPPLGRPPATPTSAAGAPRPQPTRDTNAQSRAGLQRRRPGEHLDPSLRDEIPGYRQVFPAAQTAESLASMADRNAEAERAMFSDYASGLARASQSIDVDGRDFSEAIAASDPDHHDDSRSRP